MSKKIQKTWKKWETVEKNELKKLCKESRSWAELKSKTAESNLLKDRDYRNEIRRKALHFGLTKHFTDKRRKISRKEEVRAKQFLLDESERIIPDETFKITSEAWNKPDTEIGTISRIDYGSEGYRAGLWRLSLQQAAKEGFRFNVLVGGLVHKKSLNEELKSKLEELKEQQRGLKLSVEEKREEKKQLIEDSYMECARDLARLIPRISKPSGEIIKLYMVTSKPFDGEVGDEIAKRLTALRKDNDIVYWGYNPEFPLLVKYVNKTLFPLVSQKQSWMRSDYYSTPVQRVLKDILKLSTDLPDVYGVGCFASSIFKPEGESRRAYFSIPALHKLSANRTSENQIGMRTINFCKNGEFSVKTYSFKDLIREERKLVTIPPSCSELQEAIIKEIMIAKVSSGILEYKLKEQSCWKNITREDVIKAIENTKRLTPKIVFDHASNLFDFDPKWFQEKAVYELPSDEELVEDRFVGFACIHGGAQQTNYRFIVEDMPRYILRSNADFLVGAGDFVQGTAHRMLEKRQIYRGLDNTDQEIFVARLIATVITKVFDTRFTKAIQQQQNLNTLESEELENMIRDALVTFIYLEGNHDTWKTAMAFQPLKIFEKWLIDFIIRDIKKVIRRHNLDFRGVGNIVVENVIHDQPINKIFYTTSSGLAVKVGHPYTGRNLTVSIPGEKFLEMYRESHVNFVGNWHESLNMEHFDQKIGQRVYNQLPTIQKYTLFETNKMKETDFGIGICKVKSHKGRIITSESGFYGDRGDLEKIDNELIDDILVQAGITLR